MRWPRHAGCERRERRVAQTLRRDPDRPTHVAPGSAVVLVGSPGFPSANLTMGPSRYTQSAFSRPVNWSSDLRITSPGTLWDGVKRTVLTGSALTRNATNRGQTLHSSSNCHTGPPELIIARTARSIACYGTQESRFARAVMRDSHLSFVVSGPMGGGDERTPPP